jgi:hypothetical protein
MSEATARVPRAEHPRTPVRPRRTVTITGRPDGPPPRRPDSVVRAAPRADSLLAVRPGTLTDRLPRMVEVKRRRPPRSAPERLGPRPDRIAMWALLMAVALVLVAATSSQAAPF